MMDWILALNTILWLLSNILIVYIGIALLIFCTAYPVLFDPRATTAGRLILNFAVSLLGLIALVFVGIFVDGRVEWFEYPGDILPWRPIVRFLVFFGIAYTISSLIGLLWLRRFRPHTVTTAPNESTLNVQLRRRRRK